MAKTNDREMPANDREMPGVDREMPANDREMPPMTGKCHPLLEVEDFEQKLWKIKDWAKQ